MSGECGHEHVNDYDTETCLVLQADKARHEAVVSRVIALWDQEGGWIPGASRERLAEALGVPVERVRTSQQLGRAGVVPGYIAVD